MATGRGCPSATVHIPSVSVYGRRVDFAVESEQTGASWVVRVRGEVDMATSPALESEFDTVLAATPERVGVDLGEVSFLDSSGIRVLLVARQRLADADATLAVDRMSDPVQRVFEIAGVLETLAPDA